MKARGQRALARAADSKRRLSPRSLIVAGAGGILFMAGTTAQAGWLFVLAAGVIGLVLGSVFVRQHLAGASIERSIAGRARVGDEIRVGLSLKNPTRKRVPMMRVTDRFPAFPETVALSERIEPGGSNHLEQVRVAARRGKFASGPVQLTAGAPFGFLSSTRTVEVESPTVIVPRWVELPSFPILEPSSFPSDVLHERARTGAGEEYLGVRDYRPGDPRKSVHWRSTARAGHLIVREYEEEVASRVALVLAGADAGVPPDSVFEELVSAAASIAIYALQTGHPVDLSRYEADGSITRIDGPDRFAMLDWLAAAQPVDASPIELVSGSLTRIGRRGTVVILAPSGGHAGHEIERAAQMVQSAGSRVIVCVGRCASWVPNPDVLAHEEAILDRLLGGRSSVRVLSRGGDLISELTTVPR